jgi:hypothetical protein
MEANQKYSLEKCVENSNRLKYLLENLKTVIRIFPKDKKVLNRIFSQTSSLLQNLVPTKSSITP